MPLREIAGPAGRLEALLDEPHDSRALKAAVVFAHPHPQAGGTMHTKVVFQSAKALSRIGCAVLRFNFRGAGTSEGSFSGGTGEQDDLRAALAFMRERYPSAPLWVGGMSFGAWVALTVGAREPDVSVLLGVAVPIARYDFEAVRISPTPKFFIHGERDEIAPLKDIQRFYAQAADPKELVVIDGADHLFDGKVSEAGDAVEDLLGDWP